MNELIPINYDCEQPMISARDLHKALGIKERFSAWFARYSDCFEKEVDFTGVGKPTSVNNGAEIMLSDYSITTDMAKHISMMTKTEKGKEMRQYFIDLEKAWNTPEQVFARALKMADQTIAKLKDTNKSLAEKKLKQTDQKQSLQMRCPQATRQFLSVTWRSLSARTDTR